MGVTVIKIGGSALTDKGTGEDFLDSVVERVARELVPWKKYIIIHGVGYLGHQRAKENHLFAGLRENQMAWAALREEVAGMTKRIVHILISHGIPAVEISVSDIMRTSAGETMEFRSELLEKFVELGFVPVLRGDGVVDEHSGLLVISGDRIATEIALRMDVDEIIYGTDVDGILDPLGRVIPRITPENFDSLALWDNMDFSGGMRNKVEESLRLKDVRVRIINLRRDGNLRGSLLGESIGTVIER